METRTIETRRGIKSSVRVAGPSGGRAVVYLHGAGGLLPQEPVLERLAARFRVYAPVWPGYETYATEDALEDMQDFALHGWDVVEALGIEEPPILVGHSMGGMIAAEMACCAPSPSRQVRRLVLLSAAGLWMDEHPIPDLFGTTPFELPALLFHDPAAGAKLLTGGFDFSNMDALKEFLIGNARRLGTAGKILFPIPNRRVSKRLYRMTAPALVVWGESDKLMPPVYAERWRELLPDARVVRVPGAGHMLPYEQPAAVADAVEQFLA
jgi:pimeloyl-ACP methyl ester carboxylesterase